MPRPTALYVPHLLDAAAIPPELRYQQIAQNLECYGIEVANDRRPEEIIARHQTISGSLGDFCSAQGSRNVTVFDPHRAAAPSLYISLLLAGEQHISGRKKSASARVAAGELVIHQRNDHYTYHSNDVQQLYLLPAMDAVQPLFHEKLTHPIASLEKHHLMPFVKSHMMLLHGHAATLSVRETATVLDGLHNMALLMLADVARERGLASGGQLGHLYNAARACIAQHYARPDLSPDGISRMLRHSRASLDRAFKAQGSTVMATIREVRLQKARELLENDPGLRIDRVAWLCGFSSPFIFSKNFRDRFRVPPGVWRDNFTPPG